MKARIALVALLLIAAPVFAQSNGWQEIQNGWGEMQTVPGYSVMPAPTGCVSTSVPFFGASVTLTCDGGLTYDGTNKKLVVNRIGYNAYTTAQRDALTASAGDGIYNSTTGRYEVYDGAAWHARVRLDGDDWTGPMRGRTLQISSAATVNITTCTNATPIVCTATGHPLNTMDLVGISGVTGLTNANGLRRVTKLSADTFSLQDLTGADVAGNGAFGGTATVTTGIIYANRVLVGDGTAAQPSVARASAPDSGIYFTATGVYISAGGNPALLATSHPSVDIIYPIRMGGSANTILSTPAAATLQLGAANAASPVAQTLKFQDATGSNANAAATATIKCPAGTGTGTPGACVFQAPVGGSSGSTAHTQTDALKIIGAASGGVPAVVLAATQSPASNAACTAGTITWDASYIYICTASGAWKRAALTGGY